MTVSWRNQSGQALPLLCLGSWCKTICCPETGFAWGHKRWQHDCAGMVLSWGCSGSVYKRKNLKWTKSSRHHYRQTEGERAGVSSDLRPGKRKAVSGCWRGHSAMGWREKSLIVEGFNWEEICPISKLDQIGRGEKWNWAVGIHETLLFLSLPPITLLKVGSFEGRKRVVLVVGNCWSVLCSSDDPFSSFSPRMFSCKGKNMWTPTCMAAEPLVMFLALA